VLWLERKSRAGQAQNNYSPKIARQGRVVGHVKVGSTVIIAKAALDAQARAS